jgi:signal transduction histidine kinase
MPDVLTQTELRTLFGHLLTAHDEEARSIACELHDDLGQCTAILNMRTDQLEQTLSDAPADVRHQLSAIREQIRVLDAGLRNLSRGLHPSILDDLGLIAALRALINEFRSSGEDIVLKAPDTSLELPAESAMALYRIAQEGLRNAAKHAPGAPVRVAVTAIGREVQLTIEDDGPGFDVNRVRGTGCMGLLSMQERARLAGGSLLLSTALGEGTVLIVRVPGLHQQSGDS